MARSRCARYFVFLIVLMSIILISVTVSENWIQKSDSQKSLTSGFSASVIIEENALSNRIIDSSLYEVSYYNNEYDDNVEDGINLSSGIPVIIFIFTGIGIIVIFFHYRNRKKNAVINNEDENVNDQRIERKLLSIEKRITSIRKVENVAVYMIFFMFINYFLTLYSYIYGFPGFSDGMLPNSYYVVLSYCIVLFPPCVIAFMFCEVYKKG